MLSKIGKKESATPKPTFHLEGDGALRGASFFFSGVVAIEELSCEFIELVFKRGRIELVGNNMRLALYESRCVQIKGRVEQILIKEREVLKV